MRVSASCPVCASTALQPFLEIPRAPVLCNRLFRSRDDALAAPTGPVRLACCRGCGHVFNLAFEPSAVRYSPDYENSLHFSPHFQAYARQLAVRLVDRYRLRGKRILEIGCGRGDFLTMLCVAGGNRGLGFDPSHTMTVEEHVAGATVAIVPEPWDPATPIDADLVCCRHCLEHLDDPVGFLRGLRAAIGDRTDTVVFFEVPNVLHTLRRGGIWDVIYEHFSYFSPSSLARAFLDAGFAVGVIEAVFDGQYLTIHARPATRPRPQLRVRNDLQADVCAFTREYRTRIGRWRRLLDELGHTGTRAVVWGTGSKGTSFLTRVGGAGLLDCAVDINPRKQGRYTPVTAHRIVAPHELRHHRPHLVVAMNQVYVDEIRRSLHELNLDPPVTHA